MTSSQTIISYIFQILHIRYAKCFQQQHCWGHSIESEGNNYERDSLEEQENAIRLEEKNTTKKFSDTRHTYLKLLFCISPPQFSFRFYTFQHRCSLFQNGWYNKSFIYFMHAPYINHSFHLPMLYDGKWWTGKDVKEIRALSQHLLEGIGEHPPPQRISQNSWSPGQDLNMDIPNTKQK